MKKIIKKIKKVSLILSSSIFLLHTKIYADGISGSKLATGTQALINDLTTWAYGIITAVTVLLLIYFQIRKSAAEQNEQQMWSKRTHTAIFCCIFALVANAIVQIICAYFK